jgi:hypothetical protein
VMAQRKGGRYKMEAEMANFNPARSSPLDIFRPK